MCAVWRHFWFVFDCDVSFDTFCFEGLTKKIIVLYGKSEYDDQQI